MRGKKYCDLYYHNQTLHLIDEEGNLHFRNGVWLEPYIGKKNVDWREAEWADQYFNKVAAKGKQPIL